MKFGSKKAYDNYVEAWQYAHEIGMVNNFTELFARLMTWERVNEYGEYENEIYIGTDWDKYCFSFWERRSDGSTGICGGIIFHGMRGELENGSVQLTPCGGWQIHT